MSGTGKDKEEEPDKEVGASSPTDRGGSTKEPNATSETDAVDRGAANAEEPPVVHVEHTPLSRRLSDFDVEATAPKELLSEEQKKKFELASYTLGGLLFVIILSMFLALLPIIDVPAACQNSTDKTIDEQCFKVMTQEGMRDNIWEFVKTSVPPIVTLILGYFFSRSESSQGT